MHINKFKAALMLGTLVELDIETVDDRTSWNIQVWAEYLAGNFSTLTALEIPDFVWYLGEQMGGVAEATSKLPADYTPQQLAAILIEYRTR